MDETFDFVIIGSGGGSMCAALVLRAGGKRVLVLEKTGLVGGTTAISGGVMWIPANPLMAAAGIEDDAEQALGYLNAVVGDHQDTPGTSPERRQTYVEQSPKMVQFLLDRAVRLRRVPSWPDYCALPGASEPGRTVTSDLFDINQLGEWKPRLRPGFLPLPARLEEAMALPDFKRSWASKKILARLIGRTVASRLKGQHLTSAGQALQGQMLKAALDSGVEIRPDASVKELLVEGGRVTGVLVAHHGGDRRIGARLGVLINAGGFARNPRMRQQYMPDTSTEWSRTAPGDTGEMIEEAMRVGAAIAQMDERVGNPIALPPGGAPDEPTIVHGDMAKPHSIVVDQSGERYMREANSYVEVSRAMLARHRQVPAAPSWLVVDSQFLEKYMLAGSMPGSKKPKEWYEQGFLYRGDSLEDLASACGIEPGRLRATVERFNGFAHNGRDEDYHRGDGIYDRWLGDSLHQPSPTLGTIEEAPFFAIKVYPGDVSTFGGLVTDRHARVLREDGSVIDGLYATGTSTASVMGRGCPGAGASIGPSFTWGYVAANHALQNAGEHSQPG
jgi:3-oxosteroid 1-dehydrogenase